MRTLFLTVFFVSALSCPAFAAQDPQIQELLDRIQALEKTVERQNRELGFQRKEIESLEEVGYKPSEDHLESVVKSYLETDSGKKAIAEGSPTKIKAGYKIGKGFYLESLDEKFKLYINNRLQVRYTYDDAEGEKNTSSFRIRRHKVKFTGHAFTKRLTYKVQWNLPDKDGRGLLEDAYANFKFTDFFQMRGGQYKVPYNREELISSGKQQFVDRSIASEEFNLDRDIGVMFHAKPMKGLFEYNLAVMTGAGKNQKKNTNDAMLWTARFAVNTLGKFNAYSESDLEYEENPKLALGAAFATDDGSKMFVRDSVRTFNRDANTRQVTGDLLFKWRGFSFLGAGFWREINTHAGESGFSRRGTNANGYTLQAGYFVPTPLLQKHLEFAGRYSQFDPDTRARKDTEREWGGGVNWFFKGHNNKLQADVVKLINERSLDDKDDLEFRIQYQLVF